MIIKHYHVHDNEKHYHVTMMVEAPKHGMHPGSPRSKLNLVLLHPGGGKSMDTLSAHKGNNADESKRQVTSKTSQNDKSGNYEFRTIDSSWGTHSHSTSQLQTKASKHTTVPL